MTLMQFSSGDLIADRRADYAEMLFESGDRDAANGLMADVLGLVPGWVAGWYRLGEMREAAGEIASAIDAWTEALRLDPDDRFGASLKLELAGAAHRIDTPPSAYVAALFDQYAERFDKALVEKLDYRVPELIADALGAAGSRAYGYVVDLGCGTGLMGERLRRAASFIDGCDISAGMLRKAEAKRVYDRLSQQDLQTFDPGGLRADLVVAADVFLYLGALDRIFDVAARICVEGGFFAFSVERHEGPAPMVLRPSRRYAHSEAYLSDLLARSGFEILSLDRHVIRRDRGDPVEGLIVVAQRGRRNAASADEVFAAMDATGLRAVN